MSTETEYRAMADTALELRQLHNLLRDMYVSVIISIPIYCDNKSAIAIASNPVFHDRTEHIEVDCHITRQEYKKHMISLSYILSGAQLAELFTKAQTSHQFYQVISKLFVFDPP